MHAPPTLRRSLAIPDELGRISLGELNTAASMLTRVDRKYALKRAEAETLIADLDRATRVLDIEGATAHSYASTYFDTPGLDSFRGTAQPRRRRYKIRIRSYLDSGLAFLEVKTRGPRGRTVKERIPYDPDAALEGVLTPEGALWARRTIEAAGCAAPPAETLGPALEGRYMRTTLLMAKGIGRATLDERLEWKDLRAPRPGSIGAGTRPLPTDSRISAPELVIIETKSGSAPSPLDHLLWSRGHRPVRFSKYATALAALDPELPANRWTRSLAHAFGVKRCERALRAGRMPSALPAAPDADPPSHDSSTRPRLLHLLAS
ncbi:MAG: VTC domain-containing protein [Schaalia hyovaginalis]|uniref:polyphosphate polymerase domain-containing protein n=1 Tax=Schaalia hyovaginalis TaxID=29316 RepID=UPI0023F78F50|nr:VTC domain-containing protein [Schaalia hyovaginalis]MCI7671591.1 VTC domain-containing protein [Schaalia hyovaginalis]MDY5505690.1 VTC domain-containing protein [Schaalia hyovaginalis]